MLHPLECILSGLATPQLVWVVTFSGANRAATSGSSFSVAVPRGSSLSLDNPGFGSLYGVAPIDGWSTAPGSIDTPAGKEYDIAETITPSGDITLYPHYEQTTVAPRSSFGVTTEHSETYSLTQALDLSLLLPEGFASAGSMPATISWGLANGNAQATYLHVEDVTDAETLVSADQGKGWRYGTTGVVLKNGHTYKFSAAKSGGSAAYYAYVSSITYQ